MHMIRLISAVLLLSSAPSAKPATPATHRLPFVEDNYAAAIRDARARGVPVFVEAWAPW
jgi:hypothetical protein